MGGGIFVALWAMTSSGQPPPFAPGEWPRVDATKRVRVLDATKRVRVVDARPEPRP